MPDQRLHVTVLSGILGAGITTSPNRVPNNREVRGVAVMANDMSEVNIYADLVRVDIEFSHTNEMLVEMSNGFICCTLRDNRLDKVPRHAGEGRFDYPLIESTSISEPLPVDTTFDLRDGNGQSLSDVSRLDTMVTVVDAVDLTLDFSSQDFLSDPGETSGEEDERTLVNLLVEQNEFAVVVNLNKVTDAGRDNVNAARKIIRSLNPDAEIIETDHSDLPSDAILDAGLFDFNKAHENPMWAKALYGFADHVPETEKYGVASFVHRTRQPLEPEKNVSVLEGDLPGVIRAKGHFWIATRPGLAAELALARTLSSIQPLGIWWASVSRQPWPSHGSARAEHWQEPWGDRRQELVVIGAGIDWSALKASLNSCLVPDHLAPAPGALPNLPDPFPVWQRAEEAA